MAKEAGDIMLQANISDEFKGMFKNEEQSTSTWKLPLDVSTGADSIGKV